MRFAFYLKKGRLFLMKGEIEEVFGAKMRA
jgi:hypothetical protein